MKPNKPNQTIYIFCIGESIFRNLQELLSGLVPPQIQHKFYKHVNKMEYDNNEH